MTSNIRRLIILSVLCVIALALQVGSAFAFGATQVNNPSSANQEVPDIYGDRVVWQDSAGWPSIEMKNIATGVQETVSTNESASQVTPSISGNRVAWEDSADIAMKDLDTGSVSMMTTNDKMQWNPAISGNRVVWADLRAGALDSDIWMRTIGGAEAIVVSGAGYQYAPAISGDRVVWEDNSGGGWDIRMKNVYTGSYAWVTQAGGDQSAPAIWGNFVAWEDKRGNTYDIYVKDVTGGSETKVAGDPSTALTSQADVGATSIVVGTANGMEAGDQLVIDPGNSKEEWVAVASKSGSTVYLTGSLYSSHLSGAAVQGRREQKKPAIYSSGGNYKVVWQDDRKGDNDIFMYDSSTGLTKAVAQVTGSEQVAPRIYGSRVVWQDNRNGNWDIFMVGGVPSVTDDGVWTSSLTSLHATWNYAGGGVTEYQYAIGTSPGGTDTRGWTSAGTSTEVTATSLFLVSGSTYYVSVKATDGTDWTDAGTSDGIRVDADGPPAPTGVGATPGDGAATVSWNASVDPLSGTHHYVIYRKPEGGVYSQRTTTTGLSFGDSGLTNGTRYYYKISAVDNLGNEGAQSSEVSVVPKTAAPTVTDDGTWTTSADTLHASWTAVGGVDGYEYAIGTSPGATNVRGWTGTASTEVTATSLLLAPGQAYYFSVAGVIGGNQATQVGTSNGITVDNAGPNAPGGVTGTAGDTTATVRWNASVDPTSGTDHYVVYRRPEGGVYSQRTTTTGLSFGDSGLTNSTRYYYKISGVDNAGNEGPASSEVSVVPKTAAPTVTDDGSWTKSTDSLHASWTAVAGADGYEYSIGTSAGASDTLGWTSTAGTEVTATSLSLTPGRTYYWSVAGTNGGVQMSQIGTSNGGITVDNVGPSKPASVTVTPGDTTATVRWNASVDPTSGVDRYIVQRSATQGGPYAEVASTTALFYTDTDLTNGTVYYYTVRALDRAGNPSEQSDEASTEPKLASTISIAPTTTVMTYGARVTFEGTVSPAPAAGTTVTIYADPHPYSAAAPAAETTTDAGGHYRVTVPAAPVEHTRYFARWAGDVGHLGADSVRAQAGVRVKLALYRLRSLVRRSLRQVQVFTARMWPKHYGKVLLYIQRKNGRGRWVKAAYVYLGLRNYASYSYSLAAYSYRPYYPGYYRAWVRYFGDTNHYANSSGYVTFVVR